MLSTEMGHGDMTDNDGSVESVSLMCFLLYIQFLCGVGL